MSVDLQGVALLVPPLLQHLEDNSKCLTLDDSIVFSLNVRSHVQLLCTVESLNRVGRLQHNQRPIRNCFSDRLTAHVSEGAWWLAVCSATIGLLRSTLANIAGSAGQNTIESTTDFYLFETRSLSTDPTRVFHLFIEMVRRRRNRIGAVATSMWKRFLKKVRLSRHNDNSLRSLSKNAYRN